MNEDKIKWCARGNLQSLTNEVLSLKVYNKCLANPKIIITYCKYTPYLL